VVQGAESDRVVTPDEWTIRGVREGLDSRHRTASDTCRRAFDRIAAGDPGLHAFLALDAARALERAGEIDRAARSLDAAPLRGVPFALKDNICTAGLPTTAGSRILSGFVPRVNATVVDRLERAGAVVVGKTNMDEFAMGSSTEHSAFGPVRNPWNIARTPGGSSGGSAAAVAAGLVPAALGSDTGGSVRQPAAFCGVVGLKPTYGRVSRNGLIAFASSLDQIGPITRTVEDAATVLQVIAGADPLDATAAEVPVADYVSAAGRGVGGLRLGVPRHLLGAGVDAEVARAFESALGVLAGCGATLIDVELPHVQYAVAVYYIIATAEASSNLARYDGVRYGLRAGAAPSVGEMYTATREQGFGREVKRRLLLGTYVLSAGYYDAHYLKALQVRSLITRDHDDALARTDALVLPTAPSAAFPLGERLADPLQMYLADVFTAGASLAGLPAISIPMGFSADGLPLGLQVVGRPFDEATVLRVAGAYERENEWWKREPPRPGGTAQ
jgi:aspartyl-tRNA(Asn)/glutamyl-tRNA(Gln) amidotransferase subunit A